jgi:hypothetical protein
VKSEVIVKTVSRIIMAKECIASFRPGGKKSMTCSVKYYRNKSENGKGV